MVMCAFMARLCLKDIMEEMADEEQDLFIYLTRQEME